MPIALISIAAIVCVTIALIFLGTAVLVCWWCKTLSRKKSDTSHKIHYKAMLQNAKEPQSAAQSDPLCEIINDSELGPTCNTATGSNSAHDVSDPSNIGDGVTVKRMDDVSTTANAAYQVNTKPSSDGPI